MKPTDGGRNDYAQHEHHDFLNAVGEALHDPPLQAALVRLTDTLMAGNRRGYASLADSSALRDHAKRIKEHTLAHLDRYLEQLEASVYKRGGHVHWAASAEDARRTVVEIARKAGARCAVKSKSMTTEEIHLNPALEAAGLEVTETDFGEFILQLAGERPSHLVAPAVHHTRESIARILSARAGVPLPDDPVVLAQTGRRLLREKFAAADMGITGVNFAVAETGTIVLVSNEGNARLTTTCPRVHVAVMGMEKVIPRLVDLPVFLKLLARAATGQTLSVYTTLITGPRRPGEIDGPEEFHLVILDNGRSRVLATPFRESLQCIRCGACLNACPVYRRIGGHAYGGVYAGPIGSIHMLIGLRELQQHEKGKSWRERLAYRLACAVLRRPWLYRLAQRCARLVLRPRATDGWLRKLPGAGTAWTDVRDFPAPAARSFRERWRDLGQDGL